MNRPINHLYDLRPSFLFAILTLLAISPALAQPAPEPAPPPPAQSSESAPPSAQPAPDTSTTAPPAQAEPTQAQPAPPPPAAQAQPTPPPAQTQAPQAQPAPPPAQPQRPDSRYDASRRYEMEIVQEPEPTYFAIQGGLVGLGTTDVSLGGLDIGLRWRPLPQLGLSFHTGFLFGSGDTDDDRIEFPFMVDFLGYLNTGSNFQVYGIAGAGFSFARILDNRREEDLGYLLVNGGLGLEWRLNPTFSFFFDGKMLVRYRLFGDVPPESLTGDEPSRLGVGAAFTLGTLVYF